MNYMYQVFIPFQIEKPSKRHNNRNRQKNERKDQLLYIVRGLYLLKRKNDCQTTCNQCKEEKKGLFPAKKIDVSLVNDYFIDNICRC